MCSLEQLYILQTWSDDMSYKLLCFEHNPKLEFNNSPCTGITRTENHTPVTPQMTVASLEANSLQVVNHTLVLVICSL